jgi:hypothetical protein
MAIPDEELITLFSERHAQRVYRVRFADGRSEELIDCQMWGDSTRRECIATIVRPGAGSLHSPGQAILFTFDEVAAVQISELGFDHYR